MFKPRPLEGLSADFVQIDFHDWSLMDILIRERDGVDEVRLRVGKPARVDDEAVAEYWITFGKVRGFRAEIDMLTKGVCGGAISHEHHFPVEENTAFVDALDNEFWSSVAPDVPSRKGLKEFHIWLCPMSGIIELLAETATMEEVQAEPADPESSKESL